MEAHAELGIGTHRSIDMAKSTIMNFKQLGCTPVWPLDICGDCGRAFFLDIALDAMGSSPLCELCIVHNEPLHTYTSPRSICKLTHHSTLGDSAKPSKSKATNVTSMMQTPRGGIGLQQRAHHLEPESTQTTALPGVVLFQNVIDHASSSKVTIPYNDIRRNETGQQHPLDLKEVVKRASHAHDALGAAPQMTDNLHCGLCGEVRDNLTSVWAPASCGHMFCGNCLIAYILQWDFVQESIRCPCVGCSARLTPELIELLVYQTSGVHVREKLGSGQLDELGCRDRKESLSSVESICAHRRHEYLEHRRTEPHTVSQPHSYRRAWSSPSLTMPHRTRSGMVSARRDLQDLSGLCPLPQTPPPRARGTPRQEMQDVGLATPEKHAFALAPSPEKSTRLVCPELRTPIKACQAQAAWRRPAAGVSTTQHARRLRAGKRLFRPEGHLDRTC